MQDIADRGLREVTSELLDLGGERGEYHTMCTNGPFYRERGK